MREKFYFFGSFRDTAKAIQDPQLRLAYLEAVMDYWIAGIDPPDPIIQALLIQTKFTIDRSVEISSSASIRGKKWWAPQGNKNACKNWWKQSKQAKSSKNNLTQAKTSEEEVEEEREVEENNNKNNSLDLKTSSLKNLEEEKKEKSSAKKEKNEEVRERNINLLELIKQKVESLGLIYKAWEMEWISATNICTAKAFGAVATKFWLSSPELAIAVIEASSRDQFRAGKIYNAELVYKHYEKVINQAKASFQKKQNQIAKVNRV